MNYKKKNNRKLISVIFLAPRARLELATSRLTAVRSTDWANEEYLTDFVIIYYSFYFYNRFYEKNLKYFLLQYLLIKDIMILVIFYGRK